MRISDLLVAFLSSARSSRRLYQILEERELSRIDEGNIRSALSRMKSNGLVSNTKGGWKITNNGILKFHQLELFSYFQCPFKEDAEQNTIIAFDIPENERKVRNWLRNQLKIFGYKILQQSLWIGPGPLPQSFLRRLKDLGIRRNVKIFRIKNGQS